MKLQAKLVCLAALCTASSVFGLPQESAYTIGFSTTANGSLLIVSNGTKRFPMAGYRRSFSTIAQYAQFLINDLNGTPIYDTNGALVGVEGAVVTQGRPYYYDSAGNKVYIADPILSYVGGTTGTVVVGNSLYSLTASTASAALTAVTPAPAENVWSAAPPPASASSAVVPQTTRELLAIARGPNPTTNLNTDPGGCVMPAPQCRTPDGQLGHKECVDGLWSGCIANIPVTLSISPSSLVLPLGAYASFSATLTGTYSNQVSWTATAGTIWNSSGYSAWFAPSGGGAALTATGTVYTNLSARATVSIPYAPPFVDTGRYESSTQSCARGDLGTSGCVQGTSFHTNLIVYKDRGARTEYIVCGLPFFGSSVCGIPDSTPGMTVTVTPNYYVFQTRYAGSPGLIPGNTRAEDKRWAIWFVVSISQNGVTPSTGGVAYGVDNLTGTCAVHSGTPNLVTRSAEQNYLSSCGTYP